MNSAVYTWCGTLNISSFLPLGRVYTRPAGRRNFRGSSIPSAWEDWFIAYTDEHKSARIGPGFSLFTLIIQAAISGFGVALVPSCLVSEALASGQLIEPFGQRFESPLGYYLCAPNWRSNMKTHQRFGEWLHHECRHIGQSERTLTEDEQSEMQQCHYCQQRQSES
ncbi:hypothetical protein CFB84_18185 [Burkholderia aenigmatica]|uniref:LysR substrate-binding domain-containing protein n=1 Tax=Burkholderia aenigmatica TaxID=2015348 RepID=A0A228INF4_9BURK|nr:hypothetical protein CFB84_18185 [Burkholderia aenigmatica]